jgi:hypothetical protein|tara:strand:- start:6217 stop:7377 length:1161 start_codon:yes stop_codon:yes gene_type:complete
MNDIDNERNLKRGNNYPALTSRLLNLSVSDDYEIAKKEWRITGKVWKKSPVGRYRDIILNHPSGHPHHCLCGKDIVYHFEIENTENGVKEIVGSTCINNWMVLRHMSETLNIPLSAITEEKIEQWKNIAVQTLIKEAWWDEEGEEFTQLFDEIKDLDLRMNVKKTAKKYYDNVLKEYRPVTYLRKTSSGKFGRDDYLMASIVWRWNHPDNKKAQINTRGYPNQRLLNDMDLFSIYIDEYLEKIGIEDKYAEDRKTFLENLDLDIKDRLSKLREHDISERKFLEACLYFGFPVFNAYEDGSSQWERSFLQDMRRLFIRGGEPSERQAERLKEILLTGKTAKATEKQVAYLKSLGFDKGDSLTKKEASKKIDELKNFWYKVNGGNKNE